MDCEELIKSLWLRAEDKILTMDREAKEEAARTEQETALKIKGLREEHDRKVAAESAKRAGHILSDAQNRVRLMRLANNRKLSGRLHRLTRSSLGLLRNVDYSGAFDALAMELPPLPWTSVRVNPGDTAIAQDRFPGAGIVPDESISGGMDVTTGDRSVRVINTFEKRLERAWEDILPDLIKEYYEKV